MTSATASIVDVQGSRDTRRLAIDKVGIKDLRHPVTILNRDGRLQHTVGNFCLYVDLPHDRRGTHMSRFLEILNDRVEPLSRNGIEQLLTTISATLESNNAYLELSFPYFIAKQAPVSGVGSLLDYDVTLFGEKRGETADVAVKVLVPVTSLCPCSKQISDYGAHNQRSHITLTASVQEGLWIEDLIDIVENEASCQIYGLIKRPDEKFITERAYDNPKFVEDLVRDIAARLNTHPRISAYTVESENFESIHNHSAYALIQCNKSETTLPKA
ncbi:MAG: GTP cyclohydrolase FolE2 [Gammaproteobacteria bacterium]|jgi:GTP cyclohydrolase I